MATVRLRTHPFSPQTATTVAVRSNICTCGSCEACQLRAFMSEQGEKLGWTRLPYSACSAVAEGERYWQLFAVMHDKGVLRQVRTAILQTEQETMASQDIASTNSVPESHQEPRAQAIDLWT